MNNVIDIAGLIVNKCIDDGKPIQNFMLQRLLFFVYVEFLNKHNQELFSGGCKDSPFVAWGFGPCVPYVYVHFCCWAGKPIFEKQHRGFIEKEIINEVFEMIKGKEFIDLVEYVDNCKCIKSIDSGKWIPKKLLKVVK